VSIFTRGEIICGILRKKGKERKGKDEICFKTLSVQILESRIQGVIVDMHIDEALVLVFHVLKLLC